MPRCDSCEMLSINGVACHEIGCPDSWKGSVRECNECGREFVPADRHQGECDDECYAAYHGLDARCHDGY